MTEPFDVHALAGDLLQQASTQSTGRAARTLPHPGGGLEQTLIALTEGAVTDEHETPGAASLMVIRGRVSLLAGDDAVEVGAHRIASVPGRRHRLRAEERSVVLLTVALPAGSGDAGPAERRNIGG